MGRWVYTVDSSELTSVIEENVGVRPTVDGATRLVEAHLFDVSPDLYGRRLRLEFHDRIRPERRFASLDELRAQISEDAATARRLLGRPS